jgi:transposase InsO family protein
VYSSHLKKWRGERELGTLADRPRGPRPNPERAQMKRLAQENAALKRKLEQACAVLDVPRSRLYRARLSQREPSPRPQPAAALSSDEREEVRQTLNSERFADQSPRQVYAALLDEGAYLCHWRTMYRVLTKHDEVRERRNLLTPPTYHKPELLASAPNQVWSWDITKLRGPVKWTYFYLYVLLDIYSRYVVGWMIAERENEEHYHTGLKLLTPASVHFGQAEAICQRRHAVMNAAYAAHPERFSKGLPVVAAPPKEVWINPPSKTNLP